MCVCVCVCVCVFDVGEEKERRVLGVEMAFVSGHMHRCLNIYLRNRTHQVQPHQCIGLRAML